MNKIIGLVLVALGFGVSSCASSGHVKSVGTNEFATAIHADSVQLVDVRTTAEYAEGHIAYAVNIDVNQPDFLEKARRRLNTNKTVYVYCRSGKRSLKAAEMLDKVGFRVVNLRGGIMEWTASGMSVAP